MNETEIIQNQHLGLTGRSFILSERNHRKDHGYIPEPIKTCLVHRIETKVPTMGYHEDYTTYFTSHYNRQCWEKIIKKSIWIR